MQAQAPALDAAAASKAARLFAPSAATNATNGLACAANVLPGLGHKTSEETPKTSSLLLPKTPVANAKTTAAVPEADKYALRSLLYLLRSEGAKASVALGSDMAQLGLGVPAEGELASAMFASPWLETARHEVVPQFVSPSCYTVESVVPQQQKLQNLTEETLFYIFYTMPRDAMQEAVAVELTNRNWRYHKELKLWLTKDPLSEPVPQSAQTESGIYVFFDPMSWEKVKKEYVLYYPDIA